MRILLITGLTILFLWAPYAQSQTNGFPPCSTAELSWVLNQEADYDALLAKSASGDASLEQAIEYSRAHIAWRVKLWSDLPPCAEAIDVAILMSEISSDLGVMLALRQAGISPRLNPYQQRLSIEGNQRDRLNARLAEITVIYGKRGRADCSGAGRASIGGLRG